PFGLAVRSNVGRTDLVGGAGHRAGARGARGLLAGALPRAASIHLRRHRRRARLARLRRRLVAALRLRLEPEFLGRGAERRPAPPPGGGALLPAGRSAGRGELSAGPPRLRGAVGRRALPARHLQPALPPPAARRGRGGRQLLDDRDRDPDHLALLPAADLLLAPDVRLRHRDGEFVPGRGARTRTLAQEPA